MNTCVRAVRLVPLVGLYQRCLGPLLLEFTQRHQRNGNEASACLAVLRLVQLRKAVSGTCCGFGRTFPGQDKRIHASEHICPISGPDSLTKAERSNKALEIVMSNGVNDPKNFVETTVGVTFRKQAKLFMHQKTTSRRKPLKPATLCTWQNCLDKWLNPNVGDMPLANVNNQMMNNWLERWTPPDCPQKPSSTTQVW